VAAVSPCAMAIRYPCCEDGRDEQSCRDRVLLGCVDAVDRASVALLSVHDDPDDHGVGSSGAVVGVGTSGTMPMHTQPSCSPKLPPCMTYVTRMRSVAGSSFHNDAFSPELVHVSCGYLGLQRRMMSVSPFWYPRSFLRSSKVLRPASISSKYGAQP